MDQVSFRNEVYSVVASIPSGRVLTYGQIAYLVGRPQCSRMVGQAMHNASEERNLPCHRVVNSQGRLAPFWPEQRELLEKEGVAFRKNGCVDLKACGWEISSSTKYLSLSLPSNRNIATKFRQGKSPWNLR